MRKAIYNAKGDRLVLAADGTLRVWARAANSRVKPDLCINAHCGPGTGVAAAGAGVDAHEAQVCHKKSPRSTIKEPCITLKRDLLTLWLRSGERVGGAVGGAGRADGCGGVGR